ncbi:MAG: MATE family efflux transporter [Deltaproteobacteria bacterium]|jgi:putative MATE family efflux protein|nr:MATE family efflux transporter [Syntrophaceae bacterium]
MQDFTEGRVGKQIVHFSTPLMFGNVLMSAYGMINLIWVGRLLGHKAVAAVSASLPIIMLMPAFLIGLGMATNVLIAQAFGRRDTALLKKILANSFFTSVLFCLVISAVALLLREQLLDWVNAPPEIREMALSYLTVIMAALIFQFFVNWMAGVLRGMGDAVTVLKLFAMLTVFNIIFVPLCISGFGPLPAGGVAGAAWGSSLAAVATGAIGYAYLLRFNPYINLRGWDYKADWGIIREVFAIGVPASLQMMVVSLAGVFILTLVNRYGTNVTAAFGIGMQIDMLASIPFISIGMAATTIAGQNLGAQRIDRVYTTLHASVVFGLAVALVCTLALFLFPKPIGSIFLRESADSAAVLEVVKGYYRWMAFIFPCFAAIFAIQGVLRSAGDTMALLVLSFIAMFVIRIPLAYALAGPAGLGQEGIWMAMVSSSALAVGLNWLYYKKGPWRKRKVLGGKAPPEKSAASEGVGRIRS